VTALAHKHQRATFNPELYKAPTPRTGYSDRRLQQAVIVDPETGEATEANKRKSQRTSTVLNRTATINRLVKDAKEKVSFYSPLRRGIQYSPELVPDREETQSPTSCSYPR